MPEEEKVEEVVVDSPAETVEEAGGDVNDFIDSTDEAEEELPEEEVAAE